MNCVFGCMYFCVGVYSRKLFIGVQIPLITLRVYSHLCPRLFMCTFLPVLVCVYSQSCFFVFLLVCVSRHVCVIYLCVSPFSHVHVCVYLPVYARVFVCVESAYTMSVYLLV